MGIIGIVAAMTIPTLITNNQEKGWQTSASTFERKLGEALRVMNTQQTLSRQGSSKAFLNELAKHLRVVKSCDNEDISNCFSETFNASTNVFDIVADDNILFHKDIKVQDLTSKDLGHDDWENELIGVQFINGVNAIFIYNDSCYSDPYNNDIISITGTKNNLKIGTNSIAMIYDVNGHKKPNEIGKDIGLINVELKDNCSFRSGNTCWGTFFAPYSITWNECVVEGTIGNSSNPDDLALMNKLNIPCSGTVDYWAGAVEQCYNAGKRLPTDTELITLAKYLYKNNGIVPNISPAVATFTEVEYNTSNGTKIKAPGTGFDIWTSHADSRAGALRREYEPNGTGAWNRTQGDSSVMAICVGN